MLICCLTLQLMAVLARSMPKCLPQICSGCHQCIAYCRSPTRNSQFATRSFPFVPDAWPPGIDQQAFSAQRVASIWTENTLSSLPLCCDVAIPGTGQPEVSPEGPTRKSNNEIS